MNPVKGHYSIVQCCPDLARRETVNISVVLLVPERAFLQTRLAVDNERVRHFFGTKGNDAKLLKEEANFNRALKYSMEGKILQDHPDDEYGQLKFNIIGRFASTADPSVTIVRKVLAESNVRLHLDHDLS